MATKKVIQTPIHIGVGVEIPTVPNYLHLQIEHGEENFPSIDVKDVCDEDLVAISEQWVENLLANAKQRREAK